MKLAVVTCLLSFAVLCSAYRSNEETIDLIKHLLASRDYLKESMERKLLTYGPPEPRSKMESLKKEMSSKLLAERFNLAINQCANSFKDTLNVGTLKQGWFVYPKPQAPFLPPQAQMTTTKADDGDCVFSIHADSGYTLFVYIYTSFSVDQPECAPGKALDIYAGDSSETDPPDGSICASMSGWLHIKDTGDLYLLDSEKEVRTNDLLIIHHPKVTKKVNFYIYYKFIKSSTKIVPTRPPIVMVPEFHEPDGENNEERRINLNERREFQ